jgi:hypothetical protein
MKVVVDQNLKNTVVNLDDHSFENCTFTGCTFVYTGRTFEIRNCRIFDCHARLAGEAARTVRLLQQLYLGPETPKLEQPMGSSLVH